MGLFIVKESTEENDRLNRISASDNRWSK